MKKIQSKKYYCLFLILLFSSTALTAQQTDVYFLIKKNFSIFSKTYESVALDYVDQVDPEILIRTGMDAMLETLDPYTVLFSEAQNEQAEIRSGANYAGIGADFGYRDNQVVVIAPYEGGPAEQAGIRAGDIILAVNNVSTDGLQPEEVGNLTVGEAGSVVEITIRRFGMDQPVDFELERKKIEIPNVSYAELVGDSDNVGYIKLNQFGQGSAEEIRRKILGYNDIPSIKGLIVDLRGNLGGILQEAVAIADKFIEPGITVVETRGRKQEYNSFYTSKEPVLFSKPVIVLIDGGSASASEVLAGALQDLDRAVIVGEQSFGKGLVQIVKPMPYNTSLKITISRYYTPSGRSIQSIDYSDQGRNSGVLKTEVSSGIYKTRNGRSVSEGRGIEPDIEILSSNPSLLEISLRQDNAFFNFATRFEANNDTYTEQSLSDGVYSAFMDFLQQNDFSFETGSQQLLTELEKSFTDLDGSESAITAMESLIRKEKSRMFEENEPDIRRTLFLELISRYQGAAGKAKMSLKMDPVMDKALELINDPAQVSEILEGS